VRSVWIDTVTGFGFSGAEWMVSPDDGVPRLVCGRHRPWCPVEVSGYAGTREPRPRMLHSVRDVGVHLVGLLGVEVAEKR
jgi:hypothetical protein